EHLEGGLSTEAQEETMRRSCVLGHCRSVGESVQLDARAASMVSSSAAEGGSTTSANSARKPAYHSSHACSMTGSKSAPSTGGAVAARSESRISMASLSPNVRVVPSARLILRATIWTHGAPPRSW